MTDNITLICSRCGKKSKEVQGKPVEFGIDLMEYAQATGFIWAHDDYRHRVLVFCSAECESGARCKDGVFRKRPSQGYKPTADAEGGE